MDGGRQWERRALKGRHRSRFADIDAMVEVVEDLERLVRECRWTEAKKLVAVILRRPDIAPHAVPVRSCVCVCVRVCMCVSVCMYVCMYVCM